MKLIRREQQEKPVNCEDTWNENIALLYTSKLTLCIIGLFLFKSCFAVRCPYSASFILPVSTKETQVKLKTKKK